MPHWKRRILLWTGALCVGLVAVLFAKLADLAQWVLRRIIEQSALWIWVLAPLGFFGIAWVTRRYFRGAEGSGIPQTIFALRPDAGEESRRILRVRVVIGRIFLAAAGLVCGASVGREGPTVHVGAVIASSFGRWIPHGGTSAQRRALILAGGAAGVAAAFNTPLAGIVFAIEELSRSFEERASGVTLTAVVLAGLVAIALTGDYTYFGQPVVSAAARGISIVGLGVAIICGISGGLFSRLTLLSVNGLPSVLGKWQRNSPALFAGLCGLAVAGVGYFSGGQTYGTGYVEARSILESGAHLPWAYAPARALVTLLAFLSGVPAGLLAPSLSVGAGLGQFVADASGQSTPIPFAILGMCGYLAGVTQAPLTSFVIVMEMTNQHAMVLPLMITAALATAVSKIISAPLYQTLALRYIR
ncbi:MAG: chloride channel protein [Gammaproteobacteria bacterium]